MKNIISAILLSTLAIQAQTESDDYLNFIIQIQNDTFSTTHKMDDLSPSGSATALQGVQTSSTFQLWTINRVSGSEYMLDEKIVSSYHPTAEVVITSGDPYTGVPRTRVDHPFKVSYNVAGLQSDENAPIAARSVTMNHIAVTYDTSGDTSTASNSENKSRFLSNSFGLGGGLGLLSGSGSDDSWASALAAFGEFLLSLFGAFEGFGGGGFGWSPVSGIDYNFTPLVVVVLPSSTITENGLTENTQLTSLQATDLTKAAGEEEFTIMAQPEKHEPAAMLATAKVQVWPIATGTLEGFTPGETYTKLPQVKIDVKNLYPSSITYVRAYKGDPTTTPADPIIINSSYIVLDGLVPADRDYIITELDKFITEPGSYTLELLHETPFGVDLLSQTSGLIKKSGLRVVGNLNTSE